MTGCERVKNRVCGTGEGQCDVSRGWQGRVGCDRDGQ